MNYHYQVERKTRRDFIRSTIGEGSPVCSFKRVSKTSTRERLNVLSDTGVITIYSLEDWAIITQYIATFNEACYIYEKATGTKPPRYLIEAFQLAQQYKEFEP